MFVCFLFSHALSLEVNKHVTAGSLRQNSQRERWVANEKTVFASAYPLAKAAYDNVIRFTGFFREIPYNSENKPLHV